MTKFTADEIARMRELAALGRSARDIAAAIGRGRPSVYMKMRELGIERQTVRVTVKKGKWLTQLIRSYQDTTRTPPKVSLPRLKFLETDVRSESPETAGV